MIASCTVDMMYVMALPEVEQQAWDASNVLRACARDEEMCCSCELTPHLVDRPAHTTPTKINGDYYNNNITIFMSAICN